MKMKLKSIVEESKYHSFIIVQTQRKEIAEKWDYYILSANGHLLMSSEEGIQKNQYNLSIESINYDLNHKKIILATGNWIISSLKQQEAQYISSHPGTPIRFETLSIYKALKFFYYLGQSGDRFIPIEPVYLCGYDCLLFESVELINQLLPFKTIDLGGGAIESLNGEKGSERNIFSFRSEYSLLSDLHFLNCLVRSKKLIGSYIKNESESEYRFWIEPKLLTILSHLYPYPKL